MRIDSTTPGATETALPAASAGALAVDRFRNTGRVDAELFRSAAPGDVARAAAALPPSQRGALEGALGEAGLGGLLEGVVGVVDVASDPLIETPSEQNAEVIQGEVQSRWLWDMRGQADLDAALSPFARLDRPSAALATAADVRAITDAGPG